VIKSHRSIKNYTTLLKREQKTWIYRITSVLNAETDIITRFAASPIGQVVIIVIMYVETLLNIIM
jgi:hypothetical protein